MTEHNFVSNNTQERTSSMSFWKRALIKVKLWSKLFGRKRSYNWMTCEDGWITVAGTCHQPNEALKEAMELYTPKPDTIDLAKQKQWMYKVTFYPKEILIKTAIYISQDTKEHTDNIKRCITASAHTHGVTIPESLCLMDHKTAEMILLYCHLHCLRTINIKEAVLSELVTVNNLSSVIDSILGNRELIGLLWSAKVPPNVHTVMKTVTITTVQETKKLQGYQKVLTCIYLKAGLPIPDDYVYIDIEVHDYVTRSGMYENHEFKDSRVKAR